MKAVTPVVSVSYTHLDVYKRQLKSRVSYFPRIPNVYVKVEKNCTNFIQNRPIPYVRTHNPIPRFTVNAKIRESNWT